MYFLAFLLTLQSQMPWSSLRNTERFPSFRTDGQTDMRVALLWHDHCRVQLRLSYLNISGNTLKEAVQQTMLPGTVLRYAGQDCEVEAVDLLDTKWAGTASWSDMVHGHSGIRMKFAFSTPLFTSPVQRQGNNALPFPTPLTFFTAAQQQWKNFGGPTLPCSVDQATHKAKCVVAEYHLETVKQEFQGSCSTGYLGWIEYTCLLKEKEAITSLNALARLIFFAGSGYLTEHGMGVVTVSITS